MIRKTMTMLCLLLALLGVRAQAQSLRVWMDDMTMIADGQTVTYMTVYMTDPNDLYSGFQMGITVPEGISIHQVRSGRVMVNDAKLNIYRFEGLGHSLITNMPDSKTIKLGCMDTSQNAEFYPDDADGNIVEELFTIGLTASPEMVNGEYTVEMWDVEMIHQNATGVKPSNTNLTAKMTVTGGQDAPTDIPYNMTAAGYGTLIIPFDAEVPAGLQAYTCESLEENSITTREQARITANVPVILHGTPGTYHFIGFPVSPLEDSYTEGLLTGVMKDTEITHGYVMQRQNGIVGFYRVDSADPKTIPANRCYLNASANVKMLMFDFDDEVDIADIRTQQDGKLYDLNGRLAVRNNKGIVVEKGKKRIGKRK